MTSVVICVLLTMLATGLFVVARMVRRVRVETAKLEETNLALDLRAQELSRALQELQDERDERRARLRAMASVVEDLDEQRSALAREIQARQVVQEALEESELRFYSIIESAPTAMVMINREGLIVLVNSETERLFGYPREEVLGAPVELLVPRRFHQQHPADRAGFFATPKSRRMGAGRSLYGLRKDGREFPVEIGLNPIEMEGTLFVLSAVVDITERKRAEDEIQRINEELRQKNDEMRQFVYTVSHDLKSPLVTCKGFVGLMKEDAAEGRWDDMLDSVGRIERATQRMGDLIEDLLQLSRIGLVRNEPELVDVSELVRSIAEDLDSRIQAARAELTVQDDLAPVFADPVRLRQVFENLIGNAVKYGCGAERPAIQVGGAQVNGELRYFVRDNGQGIAKGYHEKVFRLFQRLETNTEGTGVGLAAVARIMEVHGGRTWVESELGRGATFWVAFPHDEVSAVAAPPREVTTA